LGFDVGFDGLVIFGGFFGVLLAATIVEGSNTDRAIR
jgi:hypothetical protein